jgi:hypothetical protein
MKEGLRSAQIYPSQIDLRKVPENTPIPNKIWSRNLRRSAI